MRRAMLFLATMGTLLVIASGTALAQVTVTLSPEDATDLPVYSDHTVTATVRSDGDPLPGAEVTFSIESGPDRTPSTYIAITGPDGQVPFIFANSGQIGTDTIQADARGEFFGIDYSSSNSTTATFTDTTLPTVESVTPENGLARQSRSTSPTATFSERMNPDSLRDAATRTSTTFRLQQWNKQKKKWVKIPATVSVSLDERAATLDPYGDAPTLLAANKRFRAIITTDATDINANALLQRFSWTFTTVIRR